MRRVALRTLHHRRRHRVEEWKAEEVQARFAIDDAALVNRFTLVAEHRKVDPRETILEARAPHDIVRGNRLSVARDSNTIVHARDTRDTRNARGLQFTRTRTNEWHTFVWRTCPRVSTEWRAECE